MTKTRDLVHLHIRCFDGLQITLDGEVVTGFHSREAQALLCYLAVTAVVHPRIALAGLFGSDLPESSALANLSEIEQAFGYIPGWPNEMPDAVLDQYWSSHVWVCNDSALSARERALIAIGAAVDAQCPYRSLFHIAQLKVFGLDAEGIKEAGWVVQNVAGASDYLCLSLITHAQFPSLALNLSRMVCSVEINA